MKGSNFLENELYPPESLRVGWKILVFSSVGVQ